MVYAIPLSQFYDFGGSVGDDVLPRSNDGASLAITLDITFNFFGSSQTSIFVSFLHIYCKLSQQLPDKTIDTWRGLLLNFVLFLLQVNNNGAISFGAAMTNFTAQQIPIPGNSVPPFLSPYWADVDTRPSNGGFVYYRNSTDEVLLERASNHIRAVFPNTFSTFTSTWLFIATWYRVGYYSLNTDKVK